MLQERGAQIYDCDSAAKRLLRTSPQIRSQLTALIGPETYTEEGSLNKAAVAQFLLASEEHKQAVNAIVHPAVAADFMASGMEWLETAILYESGFHRRVSFDYVVAVTAPEEVRLNRIMQRDGISRAKAKEWIDRQWPQQALMEKADFVIVNDGLTDLQEQVDRLWQHTHYI